MLLDYSAPLTLHRSSTRYHCWHQCGRKRFQDCSHHRPRHCQQCVAQETEPLPRLVPNSRHFPMPLVKTTHPLPARPCTRTASRLSTHGRLPQPATSFADVPHSHVPDVGPPPKWMPPGEGPSRRCENGEGAHAAQVDVGEAKPKAPRRRLLREKRHRVG